MFVFTVKMTGVTPASGASGFHHQHQSQVSNRSTAPQVMSLERTRETKRMAAKIRAVYDKNRHGSALCRTSTPLLKEKNMELSGEYDSEQLRLCIVLGMFLVVCLVVTR